MSEVARDHQKRGGRQNRPPSQPWGDPSYRHLDLGAPAPRTGGQPVPAVSPAQSPRFALAALRHQHSRRPDLATSSRGAVTALRGIAGFLSCSRQNPDRVKKVCVAPFLQILSRPRHVFRNHSWGPQLWCVSGGCAHGLCTRARSARVCEH